MRPVVLPGICLAWFVGCTTLLDLESLRFDGAAGNADDGGGAGQDGSPAAAAGVAALGGATAGPDPVDAGAAGSSGVFPSSTGGVSSGGGFSMGGADAGQGGEPFSVGGARGDGGSSAGAGSTAGEAGAGGDVSAAGGRAPPNGGDPKGGRSASPSEGGAGAGGSDDGEVVGDFEPPSCLGMTAERAGDDCCKSLGVESQQFKQGRGTEECADCISGCPQHSLCSPDEEPEHLVRVTAFYLDKFEVTVGRFRRFVGDYDRWHGSAGFPQPGDGRNPNVNAAETGWPADGLLPADEVELRTMLACKPDAPDRENWTDSPSTGEDMPMNCVDWYTAFAFCIWDGGRLPTESEWESAAAGGEQNRVYPWGTALPTAEHANFWEGPHMQERKAPVGSFPLGNGRWGHSDLGGSTFEWTLDSYSYYTASDEPCENCAFTATSDRVIRGGSWATESWFMRATLRVYLPTGDFRNDNLGVRCARDDSD